MDRAACVDLLGLSLRRRASRMPCRALVRTARDQEHRQRGWCSAIRPGHRWVRIAETATLPVDAFRADPIRLPEPIELRAIGPWARWARRRMEGERPHQRRARASTTGKKCFCEWMASERLRL